MKTNQSIFILEASWQDDAFSVAFYDQHSTAHQYHKILIPFDEIKQVCDEFTILLQKANCLRAQSESLDLDKELKRIGRVLHNTLLPIKIREYLELVPVREIVFLLDEVCVQIPWEIFYDGHQFFALKFYCGRIVKTRQQISAKKKKEETSKACPMLILANPTDNLPSANLEAKEIKDIFEDQGSIEVSYKLKNISCAYIKNKLCEYDVLHFAGHTIHTQGDSKQSGFVLADGIFSVNDIQMLKGKEAFPRLVVCNSCQSARETEQKIVEDHAREEAIFGLASSFLAAGVQHFVGTLWDIPDDVGLIFAKEFYSRIKEGDPIARAVCYGRLRLMKEFSDKSIFWANYVVYGHPQQSLLQPSNAAIKKTTEMTEVKEEVGFTVNVVIIAVFIVFLIGLGILHYRLAGPEYQFQKILKKEQIVLRKFLTTDQINIEDIEDIDDLIFMLKEMSEKNGGLIQSKALCEMAILNEIKKETGLVWSYYEQARINLTVMPNLNVSEQLLLARVYLKLSRAYILDYNDFESSLERIRQFHEVVVHLPGNLNERDSRTLFILKNDFELLVKEALLYSYWNQEYYNEIKNLYDGLT